jgi:hypothetical protein
MVQKASVETPRDLNFMLCCRLTAETSSPLDAMNLTQMWTAFKLTGSMKARSLVAVSWGILGLFSTQYSDPA